MASEVFLHDIIMSNAYIYTENPKVISGFQAAKLTKRCVCSANLPSFLHIISKKDVMETTT